MRAKRERFKTRNIDALVGQRRYAALTGPHCRRVRLPRSEMPRMNGVRVAGGRWVQNVRTKWLEEVGICVADPPRQFATWPETTNGLERGSATFSAKWTAGCQQCPSGNVARRKASARPRSGDRARPARRVHVLGERGYGETAFHCVHVLGERGYCRGSLSANGSTSGMTRTAVVIFSGTFSPMSNVNSTKKAVQPLAGGGTVATKTPSP